MSVSLNSPRRGSSFPCFQSVIERFGHSSLHKSYMSARFESSSDLYRTNLRGHYGCVNAIELSNNGGEFIVSGGDDRRVLLWNVDKTLYHSEQPAVMKGQHRSNIFCTVFDGDNSHIFSAGNDDQAVRHDIKTGETLGVYFHDDPVYGLNVHPEQENVFLTACDNGEVQLWDARNTAQGSSQRIAKYSSAFHAAVFNPVDSVLIATANSSKGVQLWDIRFPERVLREYNKAIPKMCAMGVKWNRTGTLLTALCRRLPPVLYSIEQTPALAEFEHPGYNNVCTMKSHCFAGDKDQYIISGSDDFNVYIWKIPELPSISQKLVTVDKAFLVLSGHRSIVNQVRFNPATHMVISAGVEKVIKVWSPWTLPGADGSIHKKEPSLEQKRDLYTHEDYVDLVLDSGRPLTHEYEGGSVDEDPRMLAFFDSLIQREQRGWNSASESSLSGDDFYTNFLGLRSSESSDSDSDEASVSRIQAILHVEDDSRNSGDDSDPNSQVVLRRMRRIRRAAFIRGLIRANETQEEENVEANPNPMDARSYFIRHVTREIMREALETSSSDSSDSEHMVSLALPDELLESNTNEDSNSEGVHFRTSRSHSSRQYRSRRTRISSSESNAEDENNTTTNQIRNLNQNISANISRKRRESSASSSSGDESHGEGNRSSQPRITRRKRMKINEESDNEQNNDDSDANSAGPLVLDSDDNNCISQSEKDSDKNSLSCVCDGRDVNNGLVENNAASSMCGQSGCSHVIENGEMQGIPISCNGHHSTDRTSNGLYTDGHCSSTDNNHIDVNNGKTSSDSVKNQTNTNLIDKQA